PPSPGAIACPHKLARHRRLLAESAPFPEGVALARPPPQWCRYRPKPPRPRRRPSNLVPLRAAGGVGEQWSRRGCRSNATLLPVAVRSVVWPPRAVLLLPQDPGSTPARTARRSSDADLQAVSPAREWHPC